MPLREERGLRVGTLSPADHVGRGIGALIAVLLILGHAVVRRRRLPLGPSGKRVYQRSGWRGPVLRGGLSVVLVVVCGDLGWLIASIVT